MNFADAPFAFLTPSPQDMILIGVVAVLLFGKNLPEVGRQVGRSLMEFRKGFGDLKDLTNLGSITEAVDRPLRSSSPRQSTFNDLDDRDEATAPKFEPPRAEPKKAS